jgi:multiple antibiotic resistance protein
MLSRPERSRANRKSAPAPGRSGSMRRDSLDPAPGPVHRPAQPPAAVTLLEYSLLAFTSLFAIVDPIGTAPLFLAITPGDTAAARKRMALIACTVATGVLMLFALTGHWIFRLMGITLPAFQIAGSILLMRIALDMLHARQARERTTDEEVAAGAAMDDIAITPLGVPLLAGPGSISTALILLGQAADFAQRIALFAAIALVCGVTYWILWLATTGAARLGPLALKLATRLMGLLLAAIAVQFVVDAVVDLPFVKPLLSR